MQSWKTIGRVIYGAYCWLGFLLLGLGALLLMLVMPGLERRRRIARATARSTLRLAGIPLQVTGMSLPEQGCVVVANHVSYLDGLVLLAALPPRFGFVVKKEIDRIPLASLLLRRIGSEFVDRFNRHKGAADARRVLRRASLGDSLVFFPEGTFSKRPGLLRFHTGAFATAVRAACPVVPVVIRGARDVMPSHRLIPTPGTIRVDVLAPITAPAGDREASVHLRDEARRHMLRRLGEPDLAVA